MNAMIKVGPKGWLAIGLVATVGTAGLLALPGLGSRGQESWTDGAAIRVPTAGAPVREILWQPAEPLPGTMGKAGGVGGVGGSTDEYEPRYSADGTTLVFVRGRPGQNAELFTSKRTARGGGGWSEPTPIASVNTEHDELGPELSLDGTSLYFYSDRPGGLGGYDLWVSRATEDGWGQAVSLGANVNSAWNEYGPAMSPEGARLYFSSNRPRAGEPSTSPETWSATVRESRTRHDYDLYWADVRDGASSNAEAATAINTAADEGAPAMSPAGDYLYFASDREGGLGGFDLYRARVSAKEGFGKPEGLGAAVNSLANDLDPALTADGFRLCFSSDRLHEGAAAETRDQRVTPRYSLWSSVSREVYRSVDGAGGPRWNLLPWLLLLLLTLLPIFLLMRLMGNDVWRRRLGQMGLVARCLMVSLLIHACLASLFAIWKVGSGIIDVMQQGGGGGTRVVLESGAGGTPGGSVVGQIRGLTTGAALAVPELSSISAEVPMGSVDAPAVMVAMPELVAVPAAVVTVEDRKGAEPVGLVAARSVELAAAKVSDAAIPTAPRPDATVAEAAAAATRVDVVSGSPQATPAANQGAVVAFVPEIGAVAVPTAGALRVEAVSERVPSTVGGSGPTAVPVAAEVVVGGGAETRVPTAKGGGVPQKEAGTPSAAGMVGVEGTGLSAPVAASKAGTSGGRVDVNVAAMEGAGDGAGVVVETPSAGGGTVKQMGPTGDAGAALVPGASSGVEAGIPKVAPAAGAGGSPAGEASLPKSSGAGGPVFVDAPVTPGASGSTGAGTVIVDPRSGTGGVPAEVPLLIGEATLGRGNGPSGFEASVGSGLGNGLAAYLSSGGAGELDSRLPATPPTPVETFEQRAPEARSELVEKMGGSKETEKAVGLALDWFARHQAKDGSWSAEHFDDGCGACDGKAEVKADAAMTGMVLLCYLGAGHTHLDEGPYREVVGRALAWLVMRQTSDGDLRGGETMYGQTVSTVALCEALAMTQDPGLTRPAQRAVSFVLARAAGDQRKSERDTSVLGWLVFTVESARRAGIDVPRATFDAAGKWLEFVTVPGMPGRYTYAKGGAASAAMTAEAMFVQQILGHKRDERMMEQSARFVVGTLPKWGEGAPTYSWYYATLALFQHQGEAWKKWNEALVRELLANQKSEGKMAGSWEPTDEWSRLGGRVYQTAVCTLSLEVYYRYRAEGVRP